MLKCEVCKDRLFDLVYGLLDGDELRETQAHVDACADCQAALTKVKTSHKLIARAARAISNVPEFALPTPESEAPTVVAPPDLSAKPRKKRPIWQRPWVAWVIAASVVIAVLSPVIWYREKVQLYQQQVADARRDFKAVDLELATLPAKYVPKLEEAARRGREKADPYLHVVGPKTLEPNAKGHLEIVTRHPEGELATSEVRVKRTFTTENGQTVEDVVRVPSEGRARVSISTDGARPNSAMKLLIEAQSKYGVSRISEVVNVPPPTFVSRIDTSKALYQSRDVLFFRVLVLDRVALQPPSRPMRLKVALTHEGKAVRTVERMSGAGGILAAEFAVEETFPEGSYTLEVSAVDANQVHVLPASTRVEIVRDLPGIRLSEQRFARGKSVTGELVLPADVPAPKEIVGRLDGKPFPIAISPARPMAAPSGPPGVGGYGGGPQALKGGRAFQFKTPPLPTTAGQGGDQARLIVPVPDRKQEYGAVIPLEPTDFAIDLFPEGGDLINGVQNRLFYRVRSKSGAPVTGEGQVILLTGKNEVVDSSYQLGMGYLDFTPELKETYTVRITTPAKIENIAAPFAKLGIRTSGVVLQVCDPCAEHTPRAVGKQADPIHVTLRRQGPALKVLLVAHCRGQIVDQRWVELGKDAVDVTLQPTPETQGMIRVTAFEVAGAALEPIAERLVYRAPTQRLDLTFTPDRGRALPGEHITAKIGARDENAQPAATWILASVVDERFQAKPQSLSAHFLLFNEIRGGADLENASIIVRDSPKSMEVLELFLGTNGWRRYVSVREPGIVPAGNGAAPALVFSRENIPLETLQKRYLDKIDASLTAIRTDALKERLQLETEKTSLSVSLNVLTQQAHNFETQVQLWIRLSLGLVLAGFLLVGMLLMGFGAYRVLYGRKSPTTAFVSAFACLVACIGVYFGGWLMGPLVEQRPNLVAEANVAREAEDRKALDQRLAQGPAVKHLAEVQPIGEFSVRGGGKELQKQELAKADRKKADDATHESGLAMHNEVMMKALRERDPSANFPRPIRTPDSLRFDAARGAAEANTVPQGKAKVDMAKGKKGGGAVQRRLEYPYQPAPNAIGDTLLWHPNLYLPNGTGEVRFDIATVEATYRVLLLGHSPTGRFGFHETRLDVPTAIGR